VGFEFVGVDLTVTTSFTKIPKRLLSGGTLLDKDFI
jgi:hypothetical protein